MTHKQVFVKIDEFKDILDVLKSIKSKMAEANDTLAQIEQIKAKEDAELNNWKNDLAEASEKVNALNQSLMQQND